jgi:hypothetical protein
VQTSIKPISLHRSQGGWKVRKKDKTSLNFVSLYFHYIRVVVCVCFWKSDRLSFLFSSSENIHSLLPSCFDLLDCFSVFTPPGNPSIGENRCDFGDLQEVIDAARTELYCTCSELYWNYEYNCSLRTVDKNTYIIGIHNGSDG